MSRMQRLTGADWAVWLHHFAAAAIKGGALAAKSSAALTVGASAATQWIDLRVVGYTALAGFVYAVMDFLATTPLPTGNEIDDDPPSVTTTTTKKIDA